MFPQKLSVFLDKGNDAENLKPSSGVLFIFTVEMDVTWFC